ncbi:MAG TPA: BlaI/MecI/CopY family transcriptional regulator [Bacteroidales bacterium]|nr:BlaI/MecI/CopY family transcriptional regulator [Bacteroidales bacterium]
MKEKSKELTRAEEQVMQIIWKLEKAFVKELLSHFPDPKPAYNTVSTIVRILEKKGFVSHEAYGKSHKYYPLITKEQYREEVFSGVMKNYFNNSMQQVLSHFSGKENMDLKEADEMIRLLEEIKQQKKNK